MGHAAPFVNRNGLNVRGFKIAQVEHRPQRAARGVSSTFIDVKTAADFVAACRGVPQGQDLMIHLKIRGKPNPDAFTLAAHKMGVEKN